MTDRLSEPFVYRCHVHAIVGGDTLDLTVDLGFGITKGIRGRLIGVDAAETDNPVTSWINDWVNCAEDEAFPFLVRTEQTGKHGRYRVVLERAHDAETLNEAVIAAFPEVESYEER